MIFSFILMFSSAFLEVISIASVSPFILLISEKEKFFELKYVSKLNSILLINDQGYFLILFTFFLIFLIIFSSFIRILNIKIAFDLAAKISNDFSSESYFRVLNQPYEIQLLKNSSEVISQISNDLQRSEGAIYYSLNFVISFVMSSFLIITLLKINPQITLLSTSILLLGYLYVLKSTKKTLTNISSLVSEANKNQIRAMQEGLGATREILLEGIQMLYTKNFKKYDFIARKKTADKNFIEAIPRYAFEAIAISIMFLIALFYSLKDVNNSNVLPTLALFAFASQKLLPSMQQVYSSLASLRGVKRSLVNVLAMLELPLNKYSKSQNSIKPFLFKKSIVMKNVYFSYEKDLNYILNNINIKIFAGEKIGIIGETGSGKSTLIDLLLGLIRPVEGSILIDKKNLYDSEIDRLKLSWQKSISHVPQYIFLNDTTIKENIAFGVPYDDIDEKLVERVCKDALIFDFIAKLPYGLETIVGERGFLLSGGQRQRIGIARALYKKSQILFFDEATNALDAKTENKVLRNIINKKELTLIMITHRKESLLYCDRVYEINVGWKN